MILIGDAQHTAQAQTATGETQAIDREAALARQMAEKAPPPSIDEVIVTAQKRAENIQDVPISVSAVSQEQIKLSNMNSLTDLAPYTPNVHIAASTSAAFITMRGLGSGMNKGFEQSVGFFVDGVYMGRASYLADALIDVGRVEVLRGPQGTLFGKNTVAGAISITTGRPTEEFEAELAALYGGARQGDGGDHGNGHRFEATVAGPLMTDTLSGRAALRREYAQGILYNTTLDRNEQGADKWAATGKLKFSPAPGVEITGILVYSSLADTGNAGQLNVMAPRTRALYSVFDPAVEANADRTLSRDAPTFAERDMWAATLEASFEVFGHDLVSITGYSTYESADLLDADFGPAPILDQGNDDSYTQWSQEFRIVSPPGDFDYVAGLYGFRSRLEGVSILRILDPGSVAEAAVGALTPLAITNLVAPILGLLDPLLDPLTEQRTKLFDQVTTNAALYGQANWRPLPKLTLTLGARVSWEKKTLDISNQHDGTGLVLKGLLMEQEFTESENRSEFKISPKVSAKYDWTDQIMTYVTLARGYKSGGFNADAVAISEIEYDPERSDTFETGIKTGWWNGRVKANLSAFYTRFHDLQVSLFNGTRLVAGNAAEAVTKGLEFELRALLPWGFQLMGATGVTDARYTHFPDAPCIAGMDPPCDLSGKRLARAPTLNGLIAVNWLSELFNWGFGIVAGADALYQGRHYLNTDLDPLDAQDGYWLFNARVGVSQIDRRWSLTFFVRNVTDQFINFGGADVPLQEGSHFGVYDPGRRWSLEARMRF